LQKKYSSQYRYPINIFVFDLRSLRFITALEILDLIIINSAFLTKALTELEFD